LLPAIYGKLDNLPLLLLLLFKLISIGYIHTIVFTCRCV